MNVEREFVLIVDEMAISLGPLLNSAWKLPIKLSKKEPSTFQ